MEGKGEGFGGYVGTLTIALLIYGDEKYYVEQQHWEQKGGQCLHDSQSS